MKMDRTLTLTLLFVLFFFTALSAQKRNGHPTLSTPRGSFPVDPVAMNEARSTNTVLKEDFQDVNVPSIPAGWTSISPEGDFKTGDADDANAGGYFPVPDIPGNIFAMANDDLCNCDMSKIRLISPAFDLSGLSNMVLRFNAYHDKNWGGGDATAQISTDGGSTWNTLKVLNSSTDWQYYVLDLSAYTGNANVKVKFEWSDGGTWASGFAVDNVVVDELLANDLRVEKVWTGEMKRDLEYTMLPLGQVGDMKVGARIKNNGHDLQTNTRAAATISRQGQVLNMDTTNSMDLDSMQRAPFWVQTSFSPDSLGVHKVEMEALSDQAEGYSPDNVLTDSIQVTCHRFARDHGNYDGSSWGAGSYSNGDMIGFQAGNLFGLSNDAKASGVSFLLDTATEAGVKARAILYKLDTVNNSFDTVTVSAPYSVQSGDISTLSNPVWTKLPFDSTLTLDSGSFYLATAGPVDSSSGKISIGASGIVDHNTSYFRKDSATSWKDVNAAPMVRLIAPDFRVGLPEDTLVCADSSLTLDAGPGDSYSWSTGAQTRKVQVGGPATYSVTVTRGQCQRSDSVMVDTTELQVELPADTAICPNSTITLDAGTGDSYSWSTGEQTQTIEVGGPDTYWVTVFKEACQRTDSIVVDTVNEGCSTGIEGYAGTEGIELHPNPVRERLQLEVKGNVQLRSLRIRDLQGRLVKRFSPDVREMKVGALQKGTYLLRMRTKEGVRVSRFVKR